jgi:hypothetical protein
MQKETLFSLIRTVLMAVGAFFIGKNLLGSAIDSSTLEVIVGSTMSLISIVWGIVSKELGIEMVQSALRSILTGIGGLFVAAGKLSGDTLNAIIGLIAAIAPLLQSILARKKSSGIVQGKIDPAQLKQ